MCRFDSCQGHLYAVDHPEGPTVNPTLLAIFLALAVFCLALARLLPQPTVVRVLDIAAVVLAGLVLLVDVLTAHT